MVSEICAKQAASQEWHATRNEMKGWHQRAIVIYFKRNYSFNNAPDLPHTITMCSVFTLKPQNKSIISKHLSAQSWQTNSTINRADCALLLAVILGDKFLAYRPSPSSTCRGWILRSLCVCTFTEAGQFCQPPGVSHILWDNALEDHGLQEVQEATGGWENCTHE